MRTQVILFVLAYSACWLLSARGDVTRILSDYDLKGEIRRVVETDSRGWAVWAHSQKPTGPELFDRAKELRLKWGGSPMSEVYSPLLADVYAMPTLRADISDDQRKVLIGWLNKLLIESRTLPARTADEILFRVYRTVGPTAYGGLLDREIVLDSMLELYTRVETYWPNAKSGLETNAAGRIVVTQPTMSPPLPIDTAFQKLSTLTNEKLRAECAAILSEWNEQAEQLAMFAWFGPQNSDRREGLLKDTTNHINRAFTLTPADLAIVQASLEKHVPNPAFRERLVLAAYRGTNPFTEQIQSEGGTSRAGPHRPKADTKRGRVAKAVGAEKAQSVSDQLPAAVDSGPLATTSGMNGGSSRLWLAFTAAAALILFVLWRAQARGNPGRGK